MANEKLIVALLRPINGTGVIILGVYTLVWGLWVASPFWTVFTKAELYGALATIAPEMFWGCLAIACGLTIILGVHHRSIKALMTASLVGAWHWSMISFLYFLGDIANTGGITSLTFAVYAAYTYLNLRINRNQGVIDEKICIVKNDDIVYDYEQVPEE